MRQDENAGAMRNKLVAPRGGAQAETSDGEPRAAGESCRADKKQIMLIGLIFGFVEV